MYLHIIRLGIAKKLWDSCGFLLTMACDYRLTY